MQDHKRQENAIAMQAKLLADSPVSPVGTPLKEHPNAMSYSALSPPTSSGPLPPASNPAQEVSFDPATKDQGDKKGRLRSGSATGLGNVDLKGKEMFNDLAQQSKKGFKAMIEKFGGDREHKNDEGFVVVPQGGDDTTLSTGGSGLQRRGTGARGDPTRGMGTMRGVKVKREADEAGEVSDGFVTWCGVC